MLLDRTRPMRFRAPPVGTRARLPEQWTRPSLSQVRKRLKSQARSAAAGFGLPWPPSPAIDAGTCTGAPPTDFDGDLRPTGTTCDIGADEFVP